MAHQGNRRRLNGDIAAAAHGDPHIGLRQRGRIVDTVADHRHLMSLALQELNRIGFTVRQNPGNHLINARLFSDSVGGGWVIAGQHDQTITLAVQPG